MSRYLSRQAPVVTAYLSAFIAALGVFMMFSRYAQGPYRGGMDFDWLSLALWLAFSAPFTLLAILFALLLALIRRRWIWTGALVAVLALGCLGLIESTSDVAHAAVRHVVGSGDMGIWQFVVEFPLLVLVSLFALASVLVKARRSR
jgi:hypothetical protein